MSPGSVTEILHFFIGRYSKEMQVSEGGGLTEEQENTKVLEMDFSEAIQMMQNNEIKDAETIILLQYAQLNRLL